MFDNIKKFIQEVICLAIVILGIWLIYYTISIEYQNPQTITCEVKDKWVKTYNRGSAYLVKCDNTVYKISDLLFKGKFNSSDIYAELEVGKKYEIKTTGYRIHWLSSYQNINEYKEVEE